MKSAERHCRPSWLFNLLQTLLVLTLFIAVSAGAKTTRVDKTGAVASLAQAVLFSESGDTVIVGPGVYRESDVTIDRGITILGESWPVIVADTGNHIIVVRAPGVRLQGLVIRGSAVSFVDDNAGLLIEDTHDCVVAGNRFEDNFFAVYLAKSYDCIISDNVVVGSAASETTSGNGIHLWYSRDILVEDNSVTGHRDGIYFEFVKNSRITGNVSDGNLRYGLHFMFSDSCLYQGNRFADNGAGVAVMYTHFVTMLDNTFEHNWGRSSWGLLLKEITDSEVRRNTFIHNSVGIYIEGCNRVTVAENDLTENGWALKLMANSLDNHFERNNFIGNSFQVTTNSRRNFSHFKGNFWSDYSGYDLDRDGTGDVPFHPVSLFSLVVQQNPPTLALMHSLTVQVLDLAERLIPSLTPASLVDSLPAMEPIR